MDRRGMRAGQCLVVSGVMMVRGTLQGRGNPLPQCLAVMRATLQIRICSVKGSIHVDPRAGSVPSDP